MQLALRRAYGYAYNPLLGMRGLGDMVSDLIAAGVNPTDAAAYASATSTDPIPLVATPQSMYLQLVSQGVSPLDAQQYDPTGAAAAGFDPSLYYAAPGSTITPPTSAPSETTAPGSSVASAATAAAQIASALSRALAPTPGIFGGAPTSCPTGYVYGAPGASVQIAPGVATVGAGKCLPSTVATGIVPGVSNTTLGIAVVAVLFLFMMGKKR